MERLTLSCLSVLFCLGLGIVLSCSSSDDDDDDDDSSSVFDLCADAAESYIRECSDPTSSEHYVEEQVQIVRSACADLSATDAADMAECFNAADTCKAGQDCRSNYF